MSGKTSASAAEELLAMAAELDDSALLGVYKPSGPVFATARGSRLVAEDGRAYLDFAAGIGVNALGYGDDGVAEAFAVGVATGLLHTSNLYRTRPAAVLASELVRLSFADRVFFCNSGGEANEGAIKFARRWAREAGGPAKHEIVALRGAFHGRLFGTLAATDRQAYQEPFEPLMPGVRFVPVGDEAAARAAISAERTAAILAEPVQGEGGIRPLPADFVKLLRGLADEADALLVFDEVQCGLGRTGRLFAHEHVGVAPDMMTLAKPLAGGLPMGAVLLTERVAAAIHPGDHGTTFGGGPLTARVALEVLHRISAPEFLAEVRWKGERVARSLGKLRASHPAVTAVRGLGLMWGLELDRPVAPVIDAALDRGLLVISAGPSVIRMLPPLTIEPAELDEGLTILEEVVP